MSLRELAAADSARILEEDGATATLTAPDATVYAVHGKVDASGVSTDANGLPVAADKRAVTISALELATAGLTDLPSLKSGIWTVATTDVQGNPVTGRVDTVLLDITLGRVTLLLKRSA